VALERQHRDTFLRNDRRNIVLDGRPMARYPENCSEHHQDNQSGKHSSVSSRSRLQLPEFFRDVRIANAAMVEIDDRESLSVLHHALSNFVQVRLPLPILYQVVRRSLREKNVSGIAT